MRSGFGGSGFPEAQASIPIAVCIGSNSHASALEAFWRALEDLPEDTPLEAYENLAVLGYVAKGLPITLARERAAKFARGA